MPPAHIPHGAAIAFLHTAAIHIETFNALGREIALALSLAHAVREDLLSAAEKAGFVTPALDMKTQEALIALAEGEGLPNGIFAVGCRTPNHFEAGQGTELIAFRSHGTRYAVGRWWTLQL